MAEKDLTITSLAGGMNDTDSPSELAEDQCVLLENIELFQSALGERRNGCAPLDIAGSGLETEHTIVYLTQWFPFNEVLNPEFFAVGASFPPDRPVGSMSWAVRTRGTWRPIVPLNVPVMQTDSAYGIQTQSLNGKLFVAYWNNNGWDRLQVWDGTSFRQTGLVAPAGPIAVANEGVGTFTGIRYYRVRAIVKDGAVIKRRSEPSVDATFTPSGTGAGATLTMPGLIGEGETHWEIEASENGSTFYVITTIPIATLTYNDEIPYATGYAAGGTLSPAIGAYLTISMVKYLAVDGDRLIVGGHWSDVTKQSTVGWTPVLNDPGAGNDERLPLSVNNTVALDNYDGGPLTGLVAGSTGTWYAFKWKRIYKFTRTGDVNRAYDNLTLSSTRGAIPGSIVRGVDESGAGCFYFLDPSLGPSRLGPGGLQVIVGLRETWKRVNLNARVIARGIYYPDKQQVHWWLALDDDVTPSLKIISQVSELRAQSVIGGNGVGRGWTIATGRIAEAECAAIFTEVVQVNGIMRVSDRPFIGLSEPDHIQRCDVERTDAGNAYRAIIRTRPYIMAGLLNKWGAMTAAVLAIANATATVLVKFIRDFGLETTAITTTFAPVGAETEVVKPFDDLAMSNAATIQIEICDPPIIPGD